MKILRGIIIALCLGVMAYGGWQIFSIQSEYSKGEQSYESLESFISVPAPAPSAAKPSGTAAAPTAVTKPTEPGEESPEPTEAPTEPIAFPEVDFAALKALNPQVVGWIYGEDTAISYPIAQSRDNSYYLTHLFSGEPNGSGSIFLDCRNQRDLSDQNSIIYGHNMKNNTMFAGLNHYKRQDYYEAHPRFLLMTPGKNYVIEIFAGLVVGESSPVWQTNYAGEEAFTRWIDESLRQSVIETGVRPGPDDRIVTLSTCTYEFDNARFVVLGVLREA